MSSEEEVSNENGENEENGEEGDDDLDSFYKRKIYDPSNESELGDWEVQKRDLLQLLKCEQKEGSVFGWWVHEILVSIGGTEKLMADNDVRQALFSQLIQVQHLFLYKLERKNLAETNAISVFIAKSLFQGLFSTNATKLLETLVNQKLGLFPLLLMHVDVEAVYNFLDALVLREKPEGLMILMVKAVFGELKFQSSKSANKNQVEKLIALLATVFEDMKEDPEVFKEIADVLDPLSEFIVTTTAPLHECASVGLRLASLIIRRFARSLATTMPIFFKGLSRQIHQMVAALKQDPKHSEKGNTHRRIQLQILDVLNCLIKTHDPSLLKTLEFYQHVEHVFEALFNQLECPIFYNDCIVFIQSIVSTRKLTLISPKLIESLVQIFNLNDSRRVYAEALIREIYPIPSYNQHFPSEVVVVMARPRGKSILEMTAAEKLDKKIDALTKQMNLTRQLEEPTNNHTDAKENGKAANGNGIQSASNSASTALPNLTSPSPLTPSHSTPQSSALPSTSHAPTPTTNAAPIVSTKISPAASSHNAWSKPLHTSQLNGATSSSSSSSSSSPPGSSVLAASIASSFQASITSSAGANLSSTSSTSSSAVSGTTPVTTLSRKSAPGTKIPVPAIFLQDQQTSNGPIPALKSNSGTRSALVSSVAPPATSSATPSAPPSVPPSNNTSSVTPTNTSSNASNTSSNTSNTSNIQSNITSEPSIAPSNSSSNAAPSSDSNATETTANKSHRKHRHDKHDKEKPKKEKREKEKDPKSSLRLKPWASTYAAYNQSSTNKKPGDKK